MYEASSAGYRKREPELGEKPALALITTPHADESIALRVEGLSKHYGSTDAVAGVSFDVRQGEVFGLLGLNGAGKTTLISMLATEKRPSAGDAQLLGRSIRDEPRAVRQLIGAAPQELALYPSLTAAENLRFFGRIYGVGRIELAKRIDDLLCLIGLQDRRDDRVATYSGGMKRRLNLAVALIHRPKLILLDEPTAGVDPQSREQILTIVRKLRDDGNAILYTTHYMEEAESLCNRLAILNRGKLVAIGTMDSLLAGLDFSEVIELSGPDSRVEAAIRAIGGGCRVEQHDRLVRLFVKRAADYLAPLQKLVSRDKSIRFKIAPVSLENIFTQLTGSEVRV
jgi:ABC-2 type transport system ATP-binding protein